MSCGWCQAYAVTSVDGTNGAALQQVDIAVQANTGLFVKGAAGNYEIPTVAEGREVPENQLQATSNNTEVQGNGSTIWALSQDAENNVGLAIVKSGPKERRRFLDAELCQLSGRYFAELSAYNKVVLQRNALLKEFSRRRDMADTLEIWDEQLLAHGLPLLAARRDFLAELSELAAGQHAQLSGEKEALQLAYEPDVDEEHFAAELAANRARDLALRTTTTGPHRDDIGVRVNDIDLRRFGSQGQQRTAALSLKLAEIALVRQRTGEEPVLLLDDVFSELDAHRQELLLCNVSGTQTFITCTGVEGLLEKFPQAAKYRIKEGKANNGDGDLC